MTHYRDIRDRKLLMAEMAHVLTHLPREVYATLPERLGVAASTIETWRRQSSCPTDEQAAIIRGLSVPALMPLTLSVVAESDDPPYERLYTEDGEAQSADSFGELADTWMSRLLAHLKQADPYGEYTVTISVRRASEA